jgi:hypothetical protein
MFFIMRLFFYVRVNAELQTRSTSNPKFHANTWWNALSPTRWQRPKSSALGQADPPLIPKFKREYLVERVVSNALAWAKSSALGQGDPPLIPKFTREYLVERVVTNALARGQVIGFGTSRSTFNPEVQTRKFGGTRCP